LRVQCKTLSVVPINTKDIDIKKNDKARERFDMIEISKQFGRANMKITEEHYAHYHPYNMGEASNNQI